MRNCDSLSNLVAYLHFPLAAGNTELCYSSSSESYSFMTPAARLDPSALTRRDVKDLCDQLKKDPQSNVTSIDRMVVQPAALKRTCNAINETKGGNRTTESLGEEWSRSSSFERGKSPTPVRYPNPCSNIDRPRGFLTEDQIGGEQYFRFLSLKPMELGALAVSLAVDCL